MPRGENFHSMVRSSDRVYTSRPPANCRTARSAWDYLTKGHGPLKDMMLIEGYWNAETVGGDVVGEENVFSSRYT